MRCRNPIRAARVHLGLCSLNVAALERSDNVADSGHAFAMLKRGYTREAVLIHESEMLAARVFH